MATSFKKFGSTGLIVKDIRNGIDVESLRDTIPSIFASHASDSVSSRYSYIPTIDVLNGMREVGFIPTQIIQSGSRQEDNRGFGKHLIRFRKVNEVLAVGGYFNEGILTNSHNGACAFDFSIGAMRLICENGLCSPVGEHDAIKVRHTGTVDDVIDASFTVISNVEKQTESIDNMRRITLDRQEQELLSHAALSLKVKTEAELVGHSALLRTRRPDDVKSDLWTTFNVIQENMIKGGVRTTSRGRRMRAVNGIDENVKLNRALWTLADSFAKLKG